VLSDKSDSINECTNSVAQNKPDYSTFQSSLQKCAYTNAFTQSCNALTNETEKKCAFKYSAAINILCDVIADVVDVNMKTRLSAGDDGALICALRIECLE